MLTAVSQLTLQVEQWKDKKGMETILPPEIFNTEFRRK
jgi:hypothetical protein